MVLEINKNSKSDYFMHRLQFKWRAFKTMTMDDLSRGDLAMDNKGYYTFRNIVFTRKDMQEMFNALRAKQLIMPKRSKG